MKREWLSECVLVKWLRQKLYCWPLGAWRVNPWRGRSKCWLMTVQRMYEGNSSCTWAGQRMKFFIWAPPCISQELPVDCSKGEWTLNWPFGLLDAILLKATREQQQHTHIHSRLNWPASTLVAKAIFSYEPSEPVAATDASAYFYIKDSTGHLSHKRKLFND